MSDIWGNFDTETINTDFGPPLGTRNMFISKVEFKDSKKKDDGSGGNPMLVVTFRDEETQQEISLYLSLPVAGVPSKDNAAASNLKRFFMGIGWSDAKMAKLKKDTAADNLVGTEVTAVIAKDPKDDSFKRIKNISLRKGSPMISSASSTMSNDMADLLK